MAEITVTANITAAEDSLKKLQTAVENLSSKPIQIKVEGNFEKVTASVARVVAAQEKTKQAVEATRQAHERTAQIAAQAYVKIADSAKAVILGEQQIQKEKEKTAQVYAQKSAEVRKAEEKTAQTAEGTAKAQAKATDDAIKAVGNLAKEQEKTAQAQERTKQRALEAAKAVIQGSNDATNATKGLADAATKVTEAFTSWAQRRIWFALYNGLRQSLNTMKEMDSYLTTIQRVAGVSSEAAGKYQEQAYDAATKYGVKPADYLANVVSFTRAGYGDLAPALAEVATKMQVVGEVSSDTATQMLLAADAAYGFGDNIDAWGKVLDGVVAIGDNYATNIEKISEGIGIVAPVASQAHVSIEELSAAIGTITAVTQRSGTEAARALRSLFLNIMKDTKTEIEDGVTWTEEEIKSFQDVLMKYIPDVLQEANIEGKVVNPIKAIKALSDAFKDGRLNEQQLIEMTADLGGKLRSSQLLALIQHFDMFSDMLNLFGDSIGETDEKLAVAMTSWQSKANMLSASFTKLFNNVLGSGMAKGGLTSLTALIDILNAFDGAPAKIIAVGTAFTVVSKAITSITTGGKLASLLSFFTNPAFLAGAGIAAAFLGVRAAIDAATTSQEEYDEMAQKASQEYQSQQTKVSEITAELEEHKRLIAELEGKTGSLTEAEKSRLEVLKQESQLLERNKQIADYQAEQAARSAATAAAAAGMNSAIDLSTATALPSDLEYFTPNNAVQYIAQATSHSDVAKWISAYQIAQKFREQAYKEYNEASVEDAADLLGVVNSWDGRITAIRDMLVSHLEKQQKYYDTALDYAQKYGLYTKDILTEDEQQIRDFIEYYKGLSEVYSILMPTLFGEGASGTKPGESSGGTGEAGGTGGTGSKSSMKSYAEEQAKVQKQAEALSAAMAQNAKESRITKETYDALTAAGFNLKDSVMQDGDAFVVSAGKLEELRDDILKQCELWGFDVPKSLKTAADEAKRSMSEIIKDARSMADEANAAAQALANMQNSIKSEGDTGDTLMDYRKAYTEAMEAWQKGFYGSKKLTGFADIVLGPEVMGQIGYDYEQAGKLLGGKFFEAMFAPESADDYGLAALKYLADNIGVVTDESGNLVYGFELVDGQIVAAVNDFDALAKALGMNKDTLMTLFDALGIYRNGLNTTKDDVKDMVDAMGDLRASADDAEGTIDTQKFINRLAAEGQTVSEIYKMLKTVRESGDYTLVGDKGGGQETIEQIQKAVQQANSKDFKFDFDTNQFGLVEEAANTMVSNVTKTIEEAAGQWGGKLSVDLGTPTVNDTNVTAAEGTIETATEGISEDVTGLDNVSGTAYAYLNTDGAVEGKAQIYNISSDLQTFDKLRVDAVAAMDTGNAVDGAILVSGIITLLGSYGLLKPEAEAKLKADLADPANTVEVTKALLVAFAAGPYNAEPGVNTEGLSGEWESELADAKDTLEKYGINYDAVVGLKNEIGEKEVEKLSARITEITALLVSKDLSVKLDATDLSDAQKQQAIKDAQELLNDLRGTYTATAKLSPQGINAGTDALLTKINSTLDTLDGTYNAIVEISGSALDDQSKAEAIAQIKSDLAGLNGTFKVGIQVQSSIALQRVATMQEAIAKIKQGAESPITANITNAEADIATIQGKLDALAKGVVIPVSIVNARIPSKDVLVNGLGGFDKGYSPVRGTAETPEYYDPRTGKTKPVRSVTTGGKTYKTGYEAALAGEEPPDSVLYGDKGVTPAMAAGNSAEFAEWAAQYVASQGQEDWERNTVTMTVGGSTFPWGGTIPDSEGHTATVTVGNGTFPWGEPLPEWGSSAENAAEDAGEKAGEAYADGAKDGAVEHIFSSDPRLVWTDMPQGAAEDAGQAAGESYGAGYEAAMAGEEPPESVLFGDKGVTPAMAMEAGEEAGTAFATGTVESIDQTLAAGEETLARTRSLVSEIMGESTVSDTQAEVEGLSDAVADIPTPEPLEVDDSSVETAEAQVGELSGAIESIPDKTVTITIVYNGRQTPAPYSSADGSPVISAGGGTDLFRARAAGDRNFAGGISLVNELGPELISADGRAFIANGGAPGIVSLPRGAVIFTADETRSILTGGGIPAYASGTNAAAAALGLGTAGALAALISKGGGADWSWSGIFPTNPGNGGRGNGNGGNGNKNPPVDNTDYWAIIEAHYKDVTTAADMTLENLKYQIDLLKNAWDDEKKPIDEQIEALQDLNKTIDRQIELLGRERDKLTEPIQDEVDALKEAKDIQDDQLELAERQKAVEEARAELQNAQNERTIRFYNKETGHWEWMADQKRIQDAQEALEKAEKSLADYEYDLHIKELEAEIKAIEEDYQGKIDALNADKQANEDTIYDLEQQLRSIELKYEALIQPLEDQQTDSDRALAAIKNAWSNAEEMRREHAEGDLDNAIAHEGESGALAGGAIKELQADLSTIAAAYKPAQQNNTLASLGIQFGASTGMYNPGNILTSIAGSSTDSHNIIINGLTMPASAAYHSLLEIAGDLAIYAGE